MSASTPGTTTKSSLGTKLLTGEGGLDFVGKRKIWYGITTALIIACLLGVILRGFSLGIDFVGGTKMNMPAADLQTEQVEETFIEATGIEPELVQIVGSGDTRILEINSERLTDQQIGEAREALYAEYQPKDATGNPTPDAIGDSTVSESWGSTITERMLISLVVFLLAVFVYIAVRLQRAMAAAAMAALLVDLILIAGIYAIFGFEVTPATVIGMLTVLAFSLYDTVIVFDKVRENTQGYLSNRTVKFEEHANDAINQTVMRSISTSVISALPILALMIIAVWLMGVGTLKDLALIQLVGVVEGILSSVFLATPFLVDIKNRSKETKEHNELVDAFRNGETIPSESVDAAQEDSDVTIAQANNESLAPSSPKRTVDSPAVPPHGSNSTGSTWRPGRN